jgi:hypothetical protein
MPTIEVLETDHIDRSDSAFPTLVRLDNGDIVCGFSRGGGAHARGGTYCARSTDGGRSWGGWRTTRCSRFTGVRKTESAVSGGHVCT